RRGGADSSASAIERSACQPSTTLRLRNEVSLFWDVFLPEDLPTRWASFTHIAAQPWDQAPAAREPEAPVEMTGLGSHRQETDGTTSRAGTKKRHAAVSLKQIPQKLVIHVVVILHLGRFHEGTQQARAAVGRGLLQVDVAGLHVRAEHL